MKSNTKRGISLITLAISVVVIIILSVVTILAITNNGAISSKDELTFKTELKNFDDEIRIKISEKFVKNSSIVNRRITDKEEIAYYCKDLADSKYIDYAYISKGVLTLKRKMLTEEQIRWATEAKIKIDDGEEIIDTKEVTVLTSLSTTEWTNQGVTLTIEGLSNSTINLAEKPYSFTDGNSFQYTNQKTYTENNNEIYVVVKDENGNTYRSEKIKIENIDKISPTVPTELVTTSALNSVTVKASGSTDSQSGLKGYRYSLNGIDWSDIIPESQYYTLAGIKHDTETNVYAKSVDIALNESKSSKMSTTKTTDISGNVSITLSNYDWTPGPISASIAYSENIPEGYIVQYKLTGDTSFTDGSVIPAISQNTTIVARVYNKSIDDELAVNTENVTKIDTVLPTLTSLELISPAAGIYKKNQEIVIHATYSEELYNSAKVKLVSSITDAIPLVIKFGEGENITVNASSVENNIIVYRYTISEADNGELLLASYQGIIYDKALNQNTVNVNNIPNSGDVIAENKLPASISYTTTEIAKNIGDAMFTNSLTKVGDGVVTYSSSNMNVATVDSNTGIVTLGTTPGTTIITATAQDSATYTYRPRTATYTITLTKNSGTISYSTTSVSRMLGSGTYTHPLTKTGDGTVTYTSSDTSIATVNSNGAVSLKRVIGSTTITATVTDTTSYEYGTKVASYTLTTTQHVHSSSCYVYHYHTSSCRPNYHRHSNACGGCATQSWYYDSSDTKDYGFWTYTCASCGYSRGVQGTGYMYRCNYCAHGGINYIQSPLCERCGGYMGSHWGGLTYNCGKTESTIESYSCGYTNGQFLGYNCGF